MPRGVLQYIPCEPRCGSPQLAQCNQRNRKDSRRPSLFLHRPIAPPPRPPISFAAFPLTSSARRRPTPIDRGRTLPSPSLPERKTIGGKYPEKADHNLTRALRPTPP